MFKDMNLTETKGKLVIIGGAEDKTGDGVILREFVKIAGGAKAKIVVMTAATDHPEESAKEMIKVFKQLGAKDIQTVDVSTRKDGEDEKSLELTEKATAIYFTGGDQLHITSLMGGTGLQKKMMERFADGLLIAGTSAGAAMMGNSVILDGDGETSPKFGAVEIAPGMDFIRGCLIDTHFAQRGRYGRLLAAIAHYPQELGIGIDENTAVIIKKRQLEVIGEGAVTILDASGMSYTNMPAVTNGESLAMTDVKIHVLPKKHRFDIEKRCLITRNSSKNGR